MTTGAGPTRMPSRRPPLAETPPAGSPPVGGADLQWYHFIGVAAAFADAVTAIASPSGFRLRLWTYNDHVSASGTQEHRGEGTRLAGRSLLTLDPELGQLLTPERRAAAERELRAGVTTFPVGEWDGARLSEADPTHLGLLVVEGVLAREVVLSDTVSTELLGPGDIVRPWHLEGPPQLLPLSVRWNALAQGRLALVDRRLATGLGPYPGIRAVVGHRLSRRPQRPA